VISIGTGIGNAVGAWASGLIFDLPGSYRLAFLLSIASDPAGCVALFPASPGGVARLSDGSAELELWASPWGSRDYGSRRLRIIWRRRSASRSAKRSRTCEPLLRAITRRGMSGERRSFSRHSSHADRPATGQSS